MANLENYRKDVFTERIKAATNAATAPLYAERAAAINQAREEGVTWIKISLAMGMTQLAVQKAALMGEEPQSPVE